jgi:ADP-dependent NAD(P)H-hydrate dehydratase / NAD(P)H-hydrate epimerase
VRCAEFVFCNSGNAMKIITASEMREVDRLTSGRCGVPSLALMENAGAAVCEFICSRFPRVARHRIVILCGKGNNGGDGLVVARLLRELGARPDVFLFAAPDTVVGDAAVNLQRWRQGPGEWRVIGDAAEWQAAGSVLATVHIIVDALLGTGLRGSVEGLLARVIADVNSLRTASSVVVAVDVPSGAPSDAGEVIGPAIAADYTVTFTAPKPGQVLAPACNLAGRLLVRDVGSPLSLVDEVSTTNLRWIEPGEFASLPLRRKPAANKGDYGRVLIVAGSRGKTGAAVLSSWAALRAGAGLVTVATAENVLDTVAAPVPEIMTEPLAATASGSISPRCLDDGRFASIVQGKDVMAVGPGLSTDPETQQFVRRIVSSAGIPVVLDADGLNAFAKNTAEFPRRATPPLVLTPHPGEMARLLGSSVADVQSRRLEVARRASAEWNAWVILKGHQTVIAAPDGRAWINSTGNPGMATAGTGDVLTGILAGLIAQFGTAHFERALIFAVYLHGLAGDLAAAETGGAPLMASDLIRALPRAFAQLLSGVNRD